MKAAKLRSASDVNYSHGLNPESYRTLFVKFGGEKGIFLAGVNSDKSQDRYEKLARHITLTLEGAEKLLKLAETCENISSECIRKALSKGVAV